MDSFQTKIDDFLKQNSDSSYLLKSSIAEELRAGAPCQIGIDEAGRGPVLGPMVYCCAIAPISRTDALQKLGLDDSKVLKEEARDAAFAALNASSSGGVENKDKSASDSAVSVAPSSYFSYLIQILSPHFISTSMLDAESHALNLNQLSHNAAMDLIRHAINNWALNVREIYVDTVGPPDKYRAALQSRFPAVPHIRVEKRADSSFLIVSAASICAKVSRDRCVRMWRFVESRMRRDHTEYAGAATKSTLTERTNRARKSSHKRDEEEAEKEKEENEDNSELQMEEEEESVIEDICGADYGSGYPGDPRTRAFLSRSLDVVFGFPQFVRHSWSTATKLVEQKCVRVVWQDDADAERDAKEAWENSEAAQLGRKASAMLASSAGAATKSTSNSVSTNTSNSKKRTSSAAKLQPHFFEPECKKSDNNDKLKLKRCSFFRNRNLVRVSSIC